jgi:hypothetical protein
LAPAPEPARPVDRTERTVTGGPARLSVFADWSGDEWFDQIYAGESPINNVRYGSGTHIIPIGVPAGAVLGPSYARFRLYTPDAPGSGAFGEAYDVEVEDYAITIGEGPTPTQATTWGTAKDLFR